MNTNETQSPGSLHPVVRQKLWRVRLRGSGMERYNPSHVIAPDATAAYQTVRCELERLDYGFSKDRELLSVELVAEDYEYTETGSRLFRTQDFRIETRREPPFAALTGSAIMTHELETDPEVFDAVAKGEKTFEIRQDDRGFNVGDELLLRRTKHTGYEMRRLKYPLIFTGEQEQRKVTHILRGPIYGLADGWVILSLNAEVSEPGDRRAENATGAQPPGSLH